MTVEFQGPHFINILFGYKERTLRIFLYKRDRNCNSLPKTHTQTKAFQIPWKYKFKKYERYAKQI